MQAVESQTNNTQNAENNSIKDHEREEQNQIIEEKEYLDEELENLCKKDYATKNKFCSDEDEKKAGNINNSQYAENNQIKDPQEEASGGFAKQNYPTIHLIGLGRKVKKHSELSIKSNGNIVIFDVKSYKIFINDKNDLIIPKGILTHQTEIYSICQLKNNKTINQNDENEECESINFQYEGDYDFIYNVPQNFGIIKTQNIQFKGKFEAGFAIGRCELEIKSLKLNIICDNMWGQRHGDFYAYKLKDKLYLGQNNEEEKEFQIFGKYKDDVKHGKFSIVQSQQKYSQNYENGIKVKYLTNQEISKHTTRYLAYLKKDTISNHVFQTVKEGKWINEIIIDFYLKLVSDYLKNVNQQYKKEIQLLNTRKCQDIFSSKILDQNEYNDQYFEGIIKKFNSKQKKRMIFIMNVNQFHFVVLEYSDEQLMLFDSYQSDDQQKILINKVANFLKKKTQKNVQIRIVKVTQQNNAYDCGIHSIYNCLQLFKEKNYQVLRQTNPKHIKQLRFHISQVIINKHSHLLPKFY